MLAKDGFPKLEGVSTLFEMFESSVRRFGDCDCLGWRPQEGDSFGPYKWWTYREVHGAQARSKGAGALLGHPARMLRALPGGRERVHAGPG